MKETRSLYETAGLGSNFYSFCFYNFKINSVLTLLHRAFTITSDWQLFHKEIEFLSNYFKQNCYATKVFYNRVKAFLNKKMSSKCKPCTVPKLDLYASVPFLVNNTEFYKKTNVFVSRKKFRNNLGGHQFFLK